MKPLILGLLLFLMPPQTEPASDPNSAEAGPPARSLDLRLFRDTDRPLTGLWDLEIPDGGRWRLELDYLHPGVPDALVGRDTATGEFLLRLDRKKKGIGYEGTLRKVLSACGLEEVRVSEFLPIGDAVVMRFLSAPPQIACPPIDGGRAGHFILRSDSGQPIYLRDLSEISSSGTRSTYGIGGDRPNVGQPATPLSALSVDPGTRVRFLKRFKAPLGGAYWYEVEVPLASQQEVKPPRGYVGAGSLRFIGSLTLKRVDGTD